MSPAPPDIAAAVTALVAALQAAQPTPEAVPPQKMLTVKETAEMLRCSESLIYTQLKDGRLRGVRVGRRRLISMAEIDRLIQSGGAPA